MNDNPKLAVEIRRLNVADIEDFRELRLFALRANPESFSADATEEETQSNSVWEKRIGLPGTNDFLIGAYVRDKLVGTVGFFQLTQRKLRHKGTIWGVFVRPEFRGNGIARLLMQEALRIVGTIPGVSVIQLCVTESNPEAFSLYRSFGFIEFGKEPKAIAVLGTYLTDIHMWLDNLANADSKG